MSGPVTENPDVVVEGEGCGEPTPIERFDARKGDVGGSEVRRVLPRRTRRTVGAWCFADHFGPFEGTLAIGPHPHTCLQTVTWLLDGELLHRDSTGAEQVVRPGQLNLMTAGRGVTHSEERTSETAITSHGVQLWVAQPDETRNGDPAFEHHADLPEVDLEGAVASVLVGELAGARSPARADTHHFGAQVDLKGPASIELDAADEHAVFPLDGPIFIGDERLEVGQAAYLGPGRSELRIGGGSGTRLMLLGGTPWEDRITMWWNFVGRSRDEMDADFADWQDHHERFGTVASPLGRIDAPNPPWSR